MTHLCHFGSHFMHFGLSTYMVNLCANIHHVIITIIIYAILLSVYSF